MIRSISVWQKTLLAALLIFVFLQNLHSLDSINQDIGRHLKTGQIIWQTKHVPTTNLFSYTEPDHPFINHHWLSEVIFYGLERAVGLAGLIVFKAIIITLAFALLLLSVAPARRDWRWTMVAILAVMVFFGRTDVRPEIFSYLYLAVFWYVIQRPSAEVALRLEPNHSPRATNIGTGKFCLLIIVQILWTNSHIYFALGPFLLLALVLEQRRYWPWLLAVSTATLVNPNFIQGALAPFSILRHYGYSIVENQSIFFLTDYGILGRQIAIFELSLVLLIVSFIFSALHKQFRLFEFLVALVFGILAMKMIRNFGPYALVFAPIVISNFFPRVILPTPSRMTLGVSVTITVLLTALSWLTVNNQIFTWLQSSKRFGLAVPAGAASGVEFIKKNNLAGPMFNNFDVGSYLIWQLYPEQKVFVDGRPEAYSVEFFEKIYKPMQTDPAAWAKYSEQYGINYVFFDWHDITPWAQQFLARISHDPAWQLSYSDQESVIFTKTTSR